MLSSILKSAHRASILQSQLRFFSLGATRRVLVPVLNGSEDIETASIVDVLRRANADVIVAKVPLKDDKDSGGKFVTFSRGLKIEADKLIDEVKDEKFDAVVCPGGPGSANYIKNDTIVSVLKRQADAQRWYAAICASPAVFFEPAGLLEGVQATCYPSEQKKLKDMTRVDERVVVSGKCVTSQGPATSIEFALKLVELLYDKKTSSDIAEKLCYKS